MGKLDGKVALITGGARGQGRSHALTLAGEGADIVVCDVASQLSTVPYPMATEADLNETARLIEGLNRRCIAVKADVRDSSQMQAVVERALSEFGKIDILIANAGILSYAPAWELTESQWDDVLDTNLKGVWLATRAVIPCMMERHSGRIICIASAAGLHGFANLAHYTAAKHGVIGLVRALAIELAPHTITVNAVCPSVVNTDIVMNPETFRLFAGGKDATLEEVTPIFQELNLLPIPWIEPQDVSHAVLWLASDDARYVTGVALPVDAGFLTK
jgi:SDR family mycofactocin-dependent oxidoreductase